MLDWQSGWLDWWAANPAAWSIAVPLALAAWAGLTWLQRR